MSSVFVIADLHLGHKRVTEFRPFGMVQEHDTHIAQCWKDVVTKRDVVYVLGDVAFTAAGFELLASLPGTKKLALGNHDTRSVETYRRVFTKVHAGYVYDGALLTHVPVHPGQIGHRWWANVHGHLHSHRIDDPRYLCVSAEQVDYQPRLLCDLLEGAKQKLKNR